MGRTDSSSLLVTLCQTSVLLNTHLFVVEAGGFVVGRGACFCSSFLPDLKLRTVTAALDCIDLYESWPWMCFKNWIKDFQSGDVSIFFSSAQKAFSPETAKTK